MLVESLPSHKARPVILAGFFITIGQIAVDLDGSELTQRTSVAGQIKDRVFRARGLELAADMIAAYQDHKPLQAAALGFIQNIVSGGAFPETETRRAAGVPLLAAIVDAMDRLAESSAVQHFGSIAIAAIVARNPASQKEVLAASLRADTAIELGAHKAIIRGVVRYASMETMNDPSYGEFTIHSAGELQDEMILFAPGSVGLVGCQALELLVNIGGTRGNERRVDALLEAGGFTALVAAIENDANFGNLEAFQQSQSFGPIMSLTDALMGQVNEDVEEHNEPAGFAALGDALYAMAGHDEL